MKDQIIALITLVTLFVGMKVNAHTDYEEEGEPSDVYPDTYTFEKAAEYRAQKNYEQAIWHYINLYPQDKNRTLALLKTLDTKITDLPHLILKIFATYAPFDPEIGGSERDPLDLNTFLMQKKGQWVDEMMKSLDAEAAIGGGVDDETVMPGSIIVK